MTLISPKSEELLPDGWYPAVIGDVDERETKFGTKLLVPFDVDGGKAGIGTVGIDAWLTLPEEGKQAHPKSNLVKWGKQLFGTREFDTDELIELECEVFVEEGESNDGEAKNYVRKLRPAKKGTDDFDSAVA